MRRRVLFGVSGRRRRTAVAVRRRSFPTASLPSFRAGCLDCVDILRLPPSGDALRRPARLPLGVVLGAHGAREVGHHAQIQPRPELGERPRAEKVRRHGVVHRRVAIRREPEPSQRPAPDAAVTGDVGGVAALAVLAERLCRLFVSFVAKERRRDAVHAGHSQRPTPERPRVHQVVQLVEQRGDEPRRAPDARAIDLAAVGRRMEASRAPSPRTAAAAARAAASQSAASSSASAASAGAAAPNGTSSPPYGWYRACRLMNAVANRSVSGSFSALRGVVVERRHRKVPGDGKHDFPRRARREHERDAHRRVRERGV